MAKAEQTHTPLDKTGESAIMKIEKGVADKRLARKRVYKVKP